MKIVRSAVAGTLESSDCIVTVFPACEGTELEYSGANSVIFGKRTAALVDDILKEYKVTCARISICDQGAIEITLRARLKAALERAAGEEGEVR